MSPYETLGMAPEASDEEVARAYRALAKRYHPDLHPGDAAAAGRMGEINRAYDEIKALRQRGTDARASAPAEDPFDVYDAVWRTYYTRQNYTRPRRSPMGWIVAAATMFFLVRFILAVLFGGYGGGYYVGTRDATQGATFYPGYWYYEIIP